MLRHLVSVMLKRVYPCDGYFAFDFALIEMRHQPVEASAQCGFAAAAWTRNQNELAFLDVEGHIVD